MRTKGLISEKYSDGVPKTGYILVIAEGKVLFEKYTAEDDGLKFAGAEDLDVREIRAIHCFDGENEYRLRLMNGGKRRVESVSRKTDEAVMDPDLIYEDEMLVRPEYRDSSEGLGRIKVINRYKYTYFDTLTLDDYRLSCDCSDAERLHGCLDHQVHQKCCSVNFWNET